MQNSVRLGLAFLLGLGLAGCATRTAKAPSYDDRELRPLNQDLAAWLARLNVQPPVAAEPAVAASAPVPQETSLAARDEPIPAPQPQTNLNAPSPNPANGVNASAVQPSQFLPTLATSPGPGGATAMPPAAQAPSPPSPASDPAPAPVIAHAPPQPPAPKTTPAAPPAVEAAEPTPIETVAEAPPAPEPELPAWTALPGDSLRDAVQIWSQREGWQVEWDAQIDYDIVAALTYRGSYLDAIRGIFKAHAGAERPLLVDLYPNQKLIHVTE